MLPDLQRAEELALAGRPLEAAAIYEEMMKGGEEAQSDMLHNLVPLYIKGQRFAAALRAAEALTFFAPKLVRSWMIRSHVESKLGLGDAALSSVYRALELSPTDRYAQETRLWLLAQRLDPLDYRAAAEAHVSGFTAPRVLRKPHGGKKLRIGYVSADFRQHVMDRFIFPLLRWHNYDEVEVYCFDSSPFHDSVSEEMRALPGPTWCDVAKLSNETAARLIAGLGIDILVDLSGLSAGHRLGIFLSRPSFLQVTGIGFQPTTGAHCFDWRLADCEQQDQYTEPLWEMASAASPLPLCPHLPVTELPAKRNGFVTFGYVNGLHKLTPASIARFVHAVQAVPSSRLLLMIPSVGDLETAQNVLRRFDPIQDRIVLTGSVGGEAFCRLFGEIDVAFDPAPYGGNTTTLDTLYHGVPVVSAPPDRRLAADAWRLQGELGIHSFREDFTTQAVEWTESLGVLAEIRKGLRPALAQHAAGQPQAYVASLESAFHSMREVARAREAA